MKKYFPSSELIINSDGSVFHLHVRPEQLADKVILVGDPGRVALVASHFETKECDISSREFNTVTGTYKGKRITVTSTGIGCDNIDIVMNEMDALANIDFDTRMEKEEFRQLEDRHLRRTAALYSCRYVYLLGKVGGLRRLAEFLCRQKCGVRPADGAGLAQPSGMERQPVCAGSLRGGCGCRTGGTHCR